jgi:hypothetical protein
MAEIQNNSESISPLEHNTQSSEQSIERTFEQITPLEQNNPVIEQSIEKELVVFLERIEPEPKTLPTHTKQPDEEFPSVFGDIRDTKTERLQ